MHWQQWPRYTPVAFGFRLVQNGRRRREANEKNPQCALHLFLSTWAHVTFLVSSIAYLCSCTALSSA